MFLKKIIVSGYKSFSSTHPEIIEFDSNLTVFIGHNGTGKSAGLEALNKLFAIDHSLRGIVPSDFHMPQDEEQESFKSLSIEAWFTFNNAEQNIAIPPLINMICATRSTGEIIFRVRLEANLVFDYNPIGDVDENIWVIDGDMEDPSEDNKLRLPVAVRNAIQVNYVPANRDPLVQLKYSSKAILGRLLKAIKWSEDQQNSFENLAQELNLLACDNPALKQIINKINVNWNRIFKGHYLKQVALNFPVSNVDEILRLLQLQFMPDAQGKQVDTSQLSDGQKSLFYFALTKALLEIDKEICEAAINSQSSNFNTDKMKLPIFSFIVLEEPENHLSPHYLGRIIKLVKDFGSFERCQSVLSTHSASLVGRIEPSQIRHFRLDYKHVCTKVKSLVLPEDSDVQAKYVRGAVKAYPEIYFAKLVILGEGDSEQIILPKLLEHYEQDIDAHSISVVPLGGKHVNHFWRLLKALEIPFVTLLDFDINRNGGGFGRIKYVIEELRNFYADPNYLGSNILEKIPEWDDIQDPNSFTIKNSDNTDSNIVTVLEEKDIFFSNPLDIDYSMICAFPDIFCVKDDIYGERGPIEGKEDDEEQNSTKKELALIKAVLKKGNNGKHYDFGSSWELHFSWYRYRFLSNKSKPASHVRMLTKIEEKYPSKEELRGKLPTELKRLMKRVISLSEQVIE